MALNSIQWSYFLNFLETSLITMQWLCSYNFVYSQMKLFGILNCTKATYHAIMLKQNKGLVYHSLYMCTIFNDTAVNSGNFGTTEKVKFQRNHINY